MHEGRFAVMAAMMPALIWSVYWAVEQEPKEIVLGAHACALLAGTHWSRRQMPSRSS